MKIKYFQDTDTLYIELRATTVTETKDVDESTQLNLDASGKVCGITIEHAVAGGYMTDTANDSLAENLFSEGIQYDWSQSQSPAAATLARADFQTAATMGHTKSKRALAHMIFDGRGGGQDKERALLLLWQAFIQRDNSALEELADMLESYTESIENPSIRKAASETVQHIEELDRRLKQVGAFMHELAIEQLNRTPK